MSGRQQAQALREEILASGMNLVKVYTSPLQRALQTAVIASGRPAEECIIDLRLREMAFGDLEGEVYYHPGDSREVMQNMRTFLGRPSIYTPQGDGETFYELLYRAGEFLRDLREREKDTEGDILVVTHGGVLHGLLFHLEKRTNVDEFWETSTPNCRLLKYDEI